MLVGLFTLGWALAQEPLPEAAQAPGPLDAVVLVETGSTTCAGAFFSATGRVVTSYHCISSGGRPRITTRDGKMTRGRITAYKPGLDLAIIDVPGLAGSPWLHLAEDLPAAGEVVSVYGHPFGAQYPSGFFEGTLRWSASSGQVSAVGLRAIQIDAPVNSGNSGGPVVDDQGRIVGVVSRRIQGDGLGFASHGKDALNLSKAKPRKLHPFGGTLGARIYGTLWKGWSFSAGVRGEMVLRDRVVIAASAALPIQPKWNAIQMGSWEWESAELRLGLRQRVGVGPYALRVDAFGSVLRIGRNEASEGPVVREVEALPAFALGAGLAMQNIGLEGGAAWVPGEPVVVRAALVWAWPGNFGVF